MISDRDLRFVPVRRSWKQYEKFIVNVLSLVMLLVVPADIALGRWEEAWHQFAVVVLFRVFVFELWREVIHGKRTDGAA
jgi:hypothetical protein